ncbi:GNAT family N-acetyltransferase [Pandoraea pnomenusa]|uniref:GNAT family N-acetyltransferase n=1 Tax=Pandoraea pnomenusa TaxID=93220 RepID=UPI0033412108
MVVEAATTADLPTLAHIYYEVRIATMTWLPASAFAESDFAAHSAGEEMRVAKSRDGDILGFISVWSADGFIHMLYVKPGAQGQGVGTRLLEALPDWPTHSYRLKCLVRNLRARAFYERHGFCVTGHGVSDEGEFVEMAVK